MIVFIIFGEGGNSFAKRFLFSAIGCGLRWITIQMDGHVLLAEFAFEPDLAAQ
jgi:hypothetical protein